MGLRDRMLAGFAAQLGKPTGIRGLVVGTMLNRTNRGAKSAGLDLQDHRRAGDGDAAAHLLVFAHASS